MIRLARFIPVVLLAGAAACSDGTATQPAPLPPVVAQVELQAPATALEVGGSARFLATPRAADGAPVAGAPIVWTTSNADVATVSTLGEVQAHEAGAATIRATSGTRFAEVPVTVVPVQVASVVLDGPDALALTEGQQVTLAAEARAADGRVLTGRIVQWRSSDHGVAAVEASGRIIAVGPGLAQVIAEIEGRVASVTVRVRAAVSFVDIEPGFAGIEVGDVVQFSATARAAGGEALELAVAWSSSDPEVARLTGPARVTGVAPGRAWIIATVEGVSARVEVEVSAEVGVRAALLTVNDETLPTVLLTRQEPDGQGGTRAVRYVAGGGSIRIFGTARRYEQIFHVTLECNDAPPVGATLVFTGAWDFDPVTGDMVFHPDEGEPFFRLATTAANLLEGRQRLYAGVEVARLRYEIEFDLLALRFAR